MNVEYWQPVETGADVHSTCLNCPPRHGILRYCDDPSPGFVSILRDGNHMADTCGDAATLIRRWRGAARADPNHEWVIEVDGPLSGVRYTRRPNGRWLATHRSMGFACPLSPTSRSSPGRSCSQRHGDER